MNGNLSYSNLSNGQQFVQTVGLGSQQLLSPSQQQQFIPLPNGVQTFNLNNGAFPVQPFQQGIAIGGVNQQMQTSGPTYTCVNQNGMTFLAYTLPSIPQPQPCYQAIQTPQGLQLVQVINNPVNFNPFCVQNGPQDFFTAFNQQQGPALQQMQVVPSILESQNIQLTQQFTNQPSNQNVEEYKQEGLNSAEDYQEVEDNLESIVDDSSNSELQNEDEEEENSNGTSTTEPSENANLVAEVADPLAALTSLTSSIPTFNSNTSQQSDDPNVFTINNLPQSLSSTQQDHSASGVGDQQFPPNTRAFQLLVPTPQGMAIQTVVASYPTSPPPIINSMPNNNSFMNLDPTLTPQLINLPLQQQMQVSSLPPQTCSSGMMLPISSSDVTNGVTASAHATRTTSPCHSTTTVIQQKPQPLTAAQIQLTEVASLPVATPSGSPHYLPDSTDDLYQPTIKQSTLNVVDGINLEEIREFARTFKMRRLVLGLTQTQVGQALSATEGPAYSQSAICRFEKLDITPRSALKIRPVLENWLREAEEKQHQGQGVSQPSGLEYLMCPTSAGKVRKRRTFFSAEALVILTAHFERNAHPSGREINHIASEIGYDRDVVRVWFCNKRQSLRNNNTPQRRRSIGSNKATPSPTPPCD